MDFKKNNNFRGGGDRGGSFGKREFKAPSFGGGRGGYQGNGGDKEMFSAVCASCGKTCEVPFRPNGKKPVYCKECFALNGGPSLDRGDSRGSDRPAPRRDFSPAPSYNKPSYPSAHTHSAPQGDAGMGELKRSLESINYKLDKLVQILSDKSQSSPKAEKSSAPAETAAPKKASPSLGKLVAKVTAPAKKPATKKTAPKKKK